MPQEENKKPISFILVDDDPHMLFFLQQSFKKIEAAAEVKRLNNGEEFIRFLEECRENPGMKADCVILDLNMPRKNGWETLAEMKEKNLGAGLPVVIISHSKQSDVTELRRLGASLFLEKPIGLDEYQAFARSLVDQALHKDSQA